MSPSEQFAMMAAIANEFLMDWGFAPVAVVPYIDDSEWAAQYVPEKGEIQVNPETLVGPDEHGHALDNYQQAEYLMLHEAIHAVQDQVGLPYLEIEAAEYANSLVNALAEDCESNPSP